MNKISLIVFLIVGQVAAFAGDVPRGYLELSELDEAKEKAAKVGKLIAIVAKGEDDQCPRSAAAFENGTRAIKSDCVLVFARVAEVRKNDKLPETVTKETADASSGASVTFYIFDSGLTKLIAEAGRKELESDKTATRGFKKKVNEARKELTGK